MHSVRFLLLYGLVHSLCLYIPAEGQLLPGNQSQQLLAVQAWVVGEEIKVDVSRRATFHIAIQIPEDHHGYLDEGDEGLLIPFSFSFTALEERGGYVMLLSSPAGVRDEKIRARVLRGEGEFVFRLDIQNAVFSAEDAFPALFRYQICNDVTNICYPPQESKVPLQFAGAINGKGLPTSLPRIEQSRQASVTLSERVTALFQRHIKHFSLTLVLVFAAGLLASATPCVYPVLPITSAILMARGGNSLQGGRLHAVLYFVGIIFFYTLLGVLAATTGTALSAVMTNAWVNLGFAVIFAYFGLSMIGLYEFQVLPLLIAKLDTTSSHCKGLSGTFLMGATAGLVVSPCVGPIAGTLLLEITGQSAGATALGDAVTAGVILRGVVLMSSFGAGLGIPFLIVGWLSSRLPQAGTWLTKVKFCLGLPILYFAYSYYLKGMETARVPGNVAHAILIGVMAIGVAVFIGVFNPVGANPRPSMLLRRALGVILLTVGIYFLYNGLGQSGILLTLSASTQEKPRNIEIPAARTLLSHSTPQPEVEIRGNLHWLRDFPLARRHARVEQKPLFVDFYATWCANCKAFEGLTLQNAQLNTALKQAILVKIYDTDAIFRTFQQDHRFPELTGVGGQPFLPLFAIYSPQGVLVWKGQNYEAVRTMVAQLEQAKQAVAP